MITITALERRTCGRLSRKRGGRACNFVPASTRGKFAVWVAFMRINKKEE